MRIEKVETLLGGVGSKANSFADETESQKGGEVNMNKPKYYTIVVTDFELRMLASLPQYELRTDGKSWKSLYLLQDRIFKRNAAVLKLANILASVPADDEPAVTCYITEAEAEKE